jgi:hypothetical protein
MMIIDNKYNLGDLVYLKTDTEQLQRIITSIHINPGNLIYELSVDNRTSNHYDFEISSEANELIKIK